MLKAYLKKHLSISNKRMEQFLRDLRTGMYFDVDLLDVIHNPNTIRIDQDDEPICTKTTQVTRHGLPQPEDKKHLTQFHFYRNNIYMTITVPSHKVSDELVDQIVLSFNKQIDDYYENESYTTPDQEP